MCSCSTCRRSVGFRVLFTAAILVLLAGCTSNMTMGNGRLSREGVESIRKGTTTQDDLQAMFGPPSGITTTADGKRVLQYVNHNAQGRPSALTYVPIVNLFAAGGSGAGTFRMLQVTLDSTGRVEDYSFTEGASEVESSAGVFGTKTTSKSVLPADR